jgi:hypothetical protein
MLVSFGDQTQPGAPVDTSPATISCQSQHSSGKDCYLKYSVISYKILLTSLKTSKQIKVNFTG